MRWCLDLRLRDSWFFHLLHVEHKRLPVVFPLNGELTGMRKLVTGQLHRHLKAVSVQVAKIVHAWKRRSWCRQKKRSFLKLVWKREKIWWVMTSAFPYVTPQDTSTYHKELKHTAPKCHSGNVKVLFGDFMIFHMFFQSLKVIYNSKIYIHSVRSKVILSGDYFCITVSWGKKCPGPHAFLDAVPQRATREKVAPPHCQSGIQVCE